ncbi:MAG: hypothetical protein A3I24_01410 [Candidatus Harrisonbacteria bacterium RIFCSPLOWO2_02_FULL_41_13b]|uniref:Clp R domain-containing protein n=1 Tax=Candidatus Harrisonbacteria bacterium RIFCSPLOWO2_02_FULL_41_13b TaxID=1798409 RepID=A0A1G1ZTL0_9BACT|nr:MAG: hypothetical protein A3J53_02055 [Candidatus Harrisonbacteria bacterium RIFCSPHIGHO2_02_FULL_40_20]OGY67815.1 MAG: hypothetical protein A3I24_01410 [Candidatus Harrisonbacteria bacterium RIFCSPLOWO2_02_FULL_41_13b]
MRDSISNLKIYYDESRLKMSVAGRFLVRSIIYSTYGILIAAAIIFSTAAIPWLSSLGWLIILFIADRLLHFGKAERSFVRLSKEGINVALYAIPQVYSVLEWSFDRALALGGDFNLYVMQKLLQNKDVVGGLARMGVKPEEFISKVEEYLLKLAGQKNTKEALIQNAEQLMSAAFRHALENKSEAIEAKDLFSALGEITNENIAKLFKLFDIDAGDLENALIYGSLVRKFSGLRRLPGTFAGFIGRPYRVRHRVMNRAWTARPTPTLDQFGEDLTDLARAGKAGFLIGHQLEYGRVLDVLSRPGNPNALLIGEPGSGKETIIAHLAHELAKDRVPAPLFDKRLVKLDIGSMVAGAAEGELQRRIKKVVSEIMIAGNVILYIPDIHQLIKTSGQLRLSAAELLLPVIKSSAFSVVGSTYPREYKQHIEPDTDFASAFEPIRVQEINEEEAVRFMVYDGIFLEAQYKIVISFGAIKESVRLAKKYFRQKLLPVSAEDLLKESLAGAAQHGKKILTVDDIVKTAEKKVNIPIHKASGEEVAQLLNLEEIIHQRLVDQEEAVKGVSRALREYRSGLSRKGGPIAVFLFVGPTGVGKTELSKIMAKIQFGSSEMMTRLDMSEYQDKQSIFRLIGSPDGTVSGNLTSTILEKPYSLILLDEFEKAHSDVLNIFLQVFDDGRLTDNLGRIVDFQNTIIIATSNAHSEFIKFSLESGREMPQISEELKKKLVDYFKPELLNRFSDIVVFKSLSPLDLQAITRLQLKDFADQLREAQGVDLSFDDSAVNKLAELGHDPVFGARPLRKAISDKIKSVLAEKILRNEVARGSAIKINFKNETFGFSQ